MQQPMTAWDLLEAVYAKSGGYLANAIPLLSEMSHPKAESVRSMLASRWEKNPNAERFWIYRGASVRVA